MLASAGSLQAAVYPYGNYTAPPGVQFINVRESSGTDAGPLFQAPTGTYPTGLTFAPAGFTASAAGGSQDITDGQLNFTLASPFSIDSISLSEAGDYSLLGVGTTATQAFAGAIIRVTVTEINGMSVAPFNIPTSSASVGFNLVANGGIVKSWSFGTTDAITSSLLAGQHATRIDVSINNQLQTLSEAGSTSFIAKKNFTVFTSLGAQAIAPEPASAMLLLCIGSGTLATARRRRK